MTPSHRREAKPSGGWVGHEAPEMPRDRGVAGQWLLRWRNKARLSEDWGARRLGLWLVWRPVELNEGGRFNLGLAHGVDRTTPRAVSSVD